MTNDQYAYMAALSQPPGPGAPPAFDNTAPAFDATGAQPDQFGNLTCWTSWTMWCNTPVPVWLINAWQSVSAQMAAGTRDTPAARLQELVQQATEVHLAGKPPSLELAQQLTDVAAELQPQATKATRSPAAVTRRATRSRP